MDLQKRADIEAQNRGFWDGPSINFSKLVCEIYKKARDCSCRQHYYTQGGQRVFPAVLNHLLEAGFKVNNIKDRNDINFFGEGLSCHYKKFTSEDENIDVELYMWKNDYQIARVDVYLNDPLPF